MIYITSLHVEWVAFVSLPTSYIEAWGEDSLNEVESEITLSWSFKV